MNKEQRIEKVAAELEKNMSNRTLSAGQDLANIIQAEKLAKAAIKAYEECLPSTEDIKDLLNKQWAIGKTVYMGNTARAINKLLRGE